MWIFLSFLMLITSILLTIKINLKNFKIIKMLKTLLKDKTALFLSLGTKIGVGSIIGTTASIIIGGPSGVIWMFIFSILTSSLIYAESYLGIKYREKTKDGHIGGSYYILKNGLNKKRLAIISLLLLLIIYSFLFQMVQSNTIAHSIELTMNINKNIIFVIFIIILSITLSLNIKELLNTMNKIVPFMCILFIIIALLAITKNIKILLPSLKLLFSNITSLKSFLAGAIIGIKRSVFMNETLIGTTSLSASIDRNDKKTAINIQVLGTYIITFIIGLLITLMISIYLYKYDITNNYLELIINVFNSLIGNIGVYILIIIFILFGTTTILSGYYIGKSNLEHLTNKKLILHIFKLLFITFTLVGIFINTSLLWKIIDSFMYIMIIINIYSIIRLGDKSDWK